jgi:putative oxidoreductase
VTEAYPPVAAAYPLGAQEQTTRGWTTDTGTGLAALKHVPHSQAKEGNMQSSGICGDDTRYLAFAGRQLFSVIFIIASAGHFTPATIALAAQHGVPMASLLVPVSGLIALAGGLSLLFGYRARVGACLLVLFLVPITLTMHNFWAVTDPMMFQIQLTMFVRNLFLIGGALLFAYFGAGALSLDEYMARPLAELEYAPVNN